MSLPLWFPHAPGAARAWVERLGPWKQRLHSHAVPRPLDVSPARGAAWFPVAVDDPEVAGFLLQLRVSPSQARPPAFDEESHRRVRAWMAQVTGLSEGELPPVRFVRDEIPASFPVTGRSLEMAATVAWLSDLLGRAPLAPVVVSGTALQGAWGGVCRVEQKRAVCRIEAPDVLPEILDGECSPDALLERWFGPSWRGDLAAALDVDVSTAVTEAWEAFTRRQFSEAVQLAQRALDQGATGRDRALCLWVCGAGALHTGRAAEAHRLLDEAAARIRALDPVRDLCEEHEAEELEAFLGVALIDRGRPSLAAERLQAASERLMAARPDRRTRLVHLQVLGSLARARLMMGQADEAVRLLALSEAEWALDWERCRVQMDLAEVHRRRGALAEQRAALERAQGMLRCLQHRDRPTTSRFLQLYEARAGLRAPLPLVADPDWGDWPQPAEVAEHLLATDPDGLDRWLARHLNGAHGVTGFVLLGIAARRAVEAGSVPDEVAAAALRLADAEMDEVVRSALLALAAGDPAPWVRQCPY